MDANTLCGLYFDLGRTQEEVKDLHLDKWHMLDRYCKLAANYASLRARLMSEPNSLSAIYGWEDVAF